MKELSIEEKAKAYDEALSVAQETYTTQPMYRDWLAKMFPELKESEDERIRKALIRFHKSTIDIDGIKGADVITWLEKQGEQNHANSTKTCKGEQKTVEWHREDEQNLNTCLSYIPDEYLRRWLVDVVHVKYDKPADKVEPKFKVGDEIKTAKEESLIITKITEEGYWSGDLFICGFDEECLWDKVEQKFHKGEWVTNGIETVQITGYDIDYGYQVDYKSNLQHRDTDVIEKEYHLWTIQDAKAGDVLATWAGPFIYNGNNGGGSCPGSYCGIDTLGKFKIGVEHHWTSKKVYPATKEQRDVLENAMADAGYTFDFEKKELKKIDEQQYNDGIDSIWPVKRILANTIGKIR